MRKIIDRAAARRILEAAAGRFTIGWITEQRHAGRTAQDIAHELVQSADAAEAVMNKAVNALALTLYAADLNFAEAEVEMAVAAASSHGAFVSPRHRPC